MVDVATAPGQIEAATPSVLPGAVVRGLVVRYEQEIAALTLELDAALAEAAEAERSAGGHSIADVLALGLDADHLGSPERVVSTPPLPPVAPAAAAPVPVVPPRTTVVMRPRTLQHGAPTAAGLPSTASASAPVPSSASVAKPGRPHLAQDSWSSRFRVHWMMKAGVITALVGILLLKFG